MNQMLRESSIMKRCEGQTQTRMYPEKHGETHFDAPNNVRSPVSDAILMASDNHRASPLPESEVRPSDLCAMHVVSLRR